MSLISPDPVIPHYLLSDARQEAGNRGIGRDTGLPDLTQKTFLFRRGGIYVIAARPSDGKTTVLVELVMHHAENGHLPEYGGPAVFVSYEEPRYQIYTRLLARTIAHFRVRNHLPPGAPPRATVESFLAGKMVRRGKAAQYYSELETAAEHLDQLSSAGRLLLIDGDNGYGDAGLALHALAQHEIRTGTIPGLVAWDYFQKIRPPKGKEGASRQQQLAHVSELLRLYARGARLGVPNPGPAPDRETTLVIGAQIRRPEKSRKSEPEQPDENDIRECDDLLNDCAGLVTLFHPPGTENTIRAKICKNRYGKRDQYVHWRYEGECGYIGPKRKKLEVA